MNCFFEAFHDFLKCRPFNVWESRPAPFSLEAFAAHYQLHANQAWKSDWKSNHNLPEIFKPRDVSKKTNFWLKLTLYFIFTISQSPNKNAATCEEVRWEWADHISQLHQDMAIFTKTWLAGSTKGGNTTKGCWNFRWWNSLPLGLFDPASVRLPSLALCAGNILASYQRTWEQEMMHCNWCWHWDVEKMHLQHCRVV